MLVVVYLHLGIRWLAIGPLCDNLMSCTELEVNIKIWPEKDPAIANMLKKFGEVQSCLWEQTDRHTHHNTCRSGITLSNTLWYMHMGSVFYQYHQHKLIKATHTHTHTHVSHGPIDFLRDDQSEPVPEETFTHRCSTHTQTHNRSPQLHQHLRLHSMTVNVSPK